MSDRHEYRSLDARGHGLVSRACTTSRRLLFGGDMQDKLKIAGVMLRSFNGDFIAHRVLFHQTIPLRLESVANLREHWAKRAKRAADHRTVALSVPRNLPLPCRVTLTRIAPRLLDGDNLQSAFKALRDGIATRLNIDDGSDVVVWHYAQEKSRDKFYAVEILIEET
jgi:hypothetical protein